MMKKIVRSSWLALVLLFMYLPVVILAVYSFTGYSNHRNQWAFFFTKL